MSDLIKINNKDLSIKEFRGQRVVTFRDVDNLHERAEGTARKNFSNNKQHFILGTDYFIAKPSDVNIFPIPINNAGTYLITESGYLMLVKSLTDDLAWEVQRQLVNNYFRAKELTNNLGDLSPQLQLLINMELKQRELETAVTETKEEIQAIREVIVINPKAEWRKETNNILNSIGKKLDDYSAGRKETYETLKTRANCRPNVLVNNLKKRALENGMAPSKVDKLNLLDVLENEPRLKEIYITIVKEMAIKYKIA